MFGSSGSPSISRAPRTARPASGFSRSAGLRSAALAVVLIGTAGCASSSSPESTATPTTITTADVGESAIVSRVSDGDTLRTTAGRKVRLVQIDAPELHGDCYGKAALVALRKLTPPGTRIVLERDPALDGTDRYGRQLRYVYVNGTNVNLALVRQGAASPYFFRGTRGIFARKFLTAVADARGSRRGYWGACPGAQLDIVRGSITGPG